MPEGAAGPWTRARRSDRRADLTAHRHLRLQFISQNDRCFPYGAGDGIRTHDPELGKLYGLIRKQHKIKTDSWMWTPPLVQGTGVVRGFASEAPVPEFAHAQVDRQVGRRSYR